jgi:serine/threonine-protein kinase
MPERATGEEKDPLIGAFVGERFLISRKLGEGGMGVVYEADQTAIDRRVALKVLHPHLTDESLYARFRNEAAASSKLSHPNTITVYDFGKTDQGSLYIAMEFIEGISLDDEIRKNGALDWQRACRIGVQICGSLQDAHDHGIVHRDLKPENVMLCHRGGDADVVKVLDFGIAKIMEDDGKDQRQALTKTGMVFGTPQYMSPEQVRGEKVDARSDIYSTGIILYQMLTGQLPFRAETPMGLLTKHLLDTPPPFVQMAPQAQVPPEVEQAVMGCLAKDAAQRPQSMRALAGLMEGALGDSLRMPIARTVRAAVPGPLAPTVPGGFAATAGASASGIAQEPAPRKARTGMIIGILVGGLIFFGGGGTLAWYFLLGPGAAKPTPPRIDVGQPPLGLPVQPPLVGGMPVQQGVQQVGVPATVGDPVVSDVVEALPAVPEGPPPEGDSSKSGSKSGGGGSGGGIAAKLKDASCTQTPTDGNFVAQDIAKNLWISQTGIKACTKGIENVGSAITYSMKEGSNMPGGLRLKTNVGGVGDCLKRFVAQTVSKDVDKGYSGEAVFTITRANGGKGPVTKCAFVVSAKVQKGRTVPSPATGGGKVVKLPSKKTKKKDK